MKQTHRRKGFKKKKKSPDSHLIKKKKKNLSINFISDRCFVFVFFPMLSFFWEADNVKRLKAEKCPLLFHEVHYSLTAVKLAFYL